MDCIKCKSPLPEGAVFCPICGRKQIREQRRRVHGNGLGTVYRLPNGKWAAEKTVGWRVLPLPEDAPPGTVAKKTRTVVRIKTFRTKKEALEALPTLEKTVAERRMKGQTRTVRPTRGEQITLRALYDQWFPTHSAGKSTMGNYKAAFVLFEPLWYLPMTDLDIDDLQECLDEAEQGRRTKENARACLGLVYKYGIPRNCVPKDRNLAQFLRINEHGSTKKPGFSSDELEKIRVAAEKGGRTAQDVLCHCYLGFRPSAFLALAAADYDPGNRTFRGGIKTKAGIRRLVPVSPKIQSYVDARISTAADGYVFGDGGEAVSIKKYRADFYALLDELGISNPVDADGRHRLTPHSCRHTFATLLKRVSGSDTDKLALIGHTSTAQLRDYQDTPVEDLKKIIDLL